MAETAFFMSDNDTHDFIVFLVQSFSAEFVPEKSDKPPPFPRYTTVAEINRMLPSYKYPPRFFVLSKRWNIYPLIFDEVNAKNGQHFFCVSQRHGGPAFDFILSRSFSESSRKWIISGSFADYSYYMRDYKYLNDPSKYITFDRPMEMKEAYLNVLKYIRKNGTRSICKESGRSGPWILPGAYTEFKKEVWLRVGDGHFIPKE